ncbi:SAVED domain-containing protein [Mycetocola spongiae]|uniref:SAVED domain-containing protein n=1 Tax=Mycetocola spongiae TaxID=2859226 RepID=UPI0021F3DEB4|nr:SAVED domain-containing protein [Mycetocola spongiae]
MPLAADEGASLVHLTVDAIRNVRTQVVGIDSIHFFIARPVCCAFLLGTAIATLPPITTYEYDTSTALYVPAATFTSRLIIMVEFECSVPQPAGVDVYVITYDEDDNERRLLPSEVTDEILDRSRSFGIDKETGIISRIKHGPLVAAESELGLANVGSLGRAINDNYYGTLLIVDQTSPPVNEDVWDIDERYDIDVRDGAIVALVTHRYPDQPEQTPQEIADGLARLAAAYECCIAGVEFLLPGGDKPESWLAQWDGDDEWSERFRQKVVETLAVTAHDVVIHVATDPANTMATLMEGAAAIADFLKATQNGPLDAADVLNLLRGKHFKALIGEAESNYLEVKTQMHPISAPGEAGKRAKVELAQDIARFANGDVDAILIIGYKEASGGGNKIGSLTPVVDTMFNIPQIQDLLDARIVPPVDGLVIEKFPVTETESVLAIFVPKQPDEMQPYLVHGVVAEGKIEGAFFSIVRRRGEGSITTSPQQIHAYIVAGKRYLRGRD